MLVFPGEEIQDGQLLLLRLLDDLVVVLEVDLVFVRHALGSQAQTTRRKLKAPSSFPVSKLETGWCFQAGVELAPPRLVGSESTGRQQGAQASRCVRDYQPGSVSRRRRVLVDVVHRRARGTTGTDVH